MVGRVVSWFVLVPPGLGPGHGTYQLMYLLRVKTAAMGRVEARVVENSTTSPFAAGSS
jgi:hypothetical protein